MDKLEFPSYAKVNLFLKVLALRKDSFHNIDTIFEKIDLSDSIILRPRRDEKIIISCASAGVPLGETNLAYRSAKFLQESFNLSLGIDIEIIKRIPIGAGLGGGSSNAATVLVGLNKLWRLKLSRNQLVRLGRQLGSDVPFFIYNCAFARGTGRGDKIWPLLGLRAVKFWHILVVPDLHVSTPFIYKEYDKMRNKRVLTIPETNVKLLTRALRNKDKAKLQPGLFNSLEQVSASIYPEIRRVQEKLISLGLKASLMSGSGPAVFGIVASKMEAEYFLNKLKAEDRSWRVFITRTISRSIIRGGARWK